MAYKNREKERAKRRAYNPTRNAARRKRRREDPEWAAAEAARVRAFAAAHPEKIRAQHVAYHLANREALAAKQAWRYQQAPGPAKERARAWYAAHPEYVATRNARWRAANPEKVAAISARRRAREQQAPINDFTDAQWREMKAAYSHRCAYQASPGCRGRRMKNLTQDHLTPLNDGGAHTASNIVPACRSCNSKKGIGPALAPVQPLLLTAAPRKKDQ